MQISKLAIIFPLPISLKDKAFELVNFTEGQYKVFAR